MSRYAAANRFLCLTAGCTLNWLTGMFGDYCRIISTVLHKIIFCGHSNEYQQHMSQLMRLWYLSHRRPAKAQASLRICAVSPEPSLFTCISTVSPEPLQFAHMKYGSRRIVRPKITHLASLDGCACAIEELVLRRKKTAIISLNGLYAFIEKYWKLSLNKHQIPTISVSLWMVKTLRVQLLLFSLNAGLTGLESNWSEPEFVCSTESVFVMM